LIGRTDSMAADLGRTA